jgi:hypothetical protein
MMLLVLHLLRVSVELLRLGVCTVSTLHSSPQEQYGGIPSAQCPVDSRCWWSDLFCAVLAIVMG